MCWKNATEYSSSKTNTSLKKALKKVATCKKLHIYVVKSWFKAILQNITSYTGTYTHTYRLHLSSTSSERIRMKKVITCYTLALLPSKNLHSLISVNNLQQTEYTDKCTRQFPQNNLFQSGNWWNLKTHISEEHQVGEGYLRFIKKLKYP